MPTSYVHVEVAELRSRSFRGIEAEARIFHPGGPPVTVLVEAGGGQQPFWQVTRMDAASPEALEAVYEHIEREELLYRISIALTLANLWDSAKASSDRLWDLDHGRDD